MVQALPGVNGGSSSHTDGMLQVHGMLHHIDIGIEVRIEVKVEPTQDHCQCNSNKIARCGGLHEFRRAVCDLELQFGRYNIFFRRRGFVGRAPERAPATSVMQKKPSHY